MMFPHQAFDLHRPAAPERSLSWSSTSSSKVDKEFNADQMPANPPEPAMAEHRDGQGNSGEDVEEQELQTCSRRPTGQRTNNSFD
jgi:hypothetical protein